MLNKMISQSFMKYADVGQSPEATQGDVSQDPNAQAQMAPPVTDQQMAGVSPTADPIQLLGMAMQNMVKSMNQMIDIYYQMTGSNPAASDTSMATQPGTTDPNMATQATAPQPGKTASMSWDDLLKGF